MFVVCEAQERVGHKGLASCLPGSGSVSVSDGGKSRLQFADGILNLPLFSLNLSLCKPPHKAFVGVPSEIGCVKFVAVS